MNQHKKFILTPVDNILREGISAIKCLGDGIEVYSVSHYIMQSIFLRMCGAQEQKMKCIMWELAHNDFEFRYDFLTKHSQNYFSEYKEKSEVYKNLILQIKKVEIDFSPHDYLFDINLLDKIKEIIEEIFFYSNLKICFQRSYINYIEIIWFRFEKKHIAPNTSKIFCDNTMRNGEKNLKSIYEDHVYKNRNRIAHNTTSYQDNLPTLSRLEKEDYKYENYFLWFSILILIDNIFIELYKKYLEILDRKKFL